MRVLLIDNYDSYTYNLYQLLAQVCGPRVTVLVNDDDRLAALDATAFDAVVISPGPGRPHRVSDLGRCGDVLRQHPQLPVLGVCLGHQALARLAGARVVEGAPRHGHLSQVRHDGEELFAGLPKSFTVTRYHSLQVVEPLPATLSATAWAENGVIMALRHRELPRWGVQFHPESVATEHGAALVANFARLAAGAGSARWAAPAHTGSARKAAPTRAEVGWQRFERAADGPPLRLSVATLGRAVDPSEVFTELYADREHAFWLDSSRHDDGSARFSFLGDDSGPLAEVLTHRVGAGLVEVRCGDQVTRVPGSVFEVLERRLAARAVAAVDLPFDLTAGYVGYFGYEEKGDCGAADRRRAVTPDAVWMLADRLIAVDHREDETYLVAAHPPTRPDVTAARAWLAATAERLRRLGPCLADDVPALDWSAMPVERLAADVRLARDRDQYLANIKSCLEELRRGESYEICLTNRIHLPPLDDPLRFYLVLRRINPAPYAAYLRLGDISVMGASPECFLRVHRDGIVESSPIKGTAPRGADPDADEKLRASLVTSAKTRAENLMIVDLLRNDLGRVCEVGSVQVTRYLVTESHPTLHQLVSTIQGQLLPTVGPVQCVRTCFPGGSMTGAPKLRTMEIIDRLEEAPRGVYSGALGYFGLGGGADLSIVIRTAVATPDGVEIGTGGAIVADSDPEQEHAEIMLKAQALVAAYQLARQERRASRAGSLPAVGR